MKKMYIGLRKKYIILKLIGTFLSKKTNVFDYLMVETYIIKYIFVIFHLTKIPKDYVLKNNKDTWKIQWD